MHSDQSQPDPSRSYRTLALGTRSVAETEVRRSRFLAVVRRVPDEPAARAMIEQLRVTHRDARHHCSAFILGPEPSTERSNDDGEPSGTAGKPMLEVLRGQGLSDVAAVVVRWFGGTKLGTGGLVRAYAEAVQQALASASLVTRHEVGHYELQLSHADAGRVESALRAGEVEVLGVRHGEQAVLELATNQEAALVSQVRELTAGAASPTKLGTIWVDG
ncbi:IMPACT family protein [Parenemella sanctibonifatiensis]|uniref:IMPACT family protein n=1 Tax=Parenemella sanctibonifatiensis TaxID=2016505 RepID=A0A255EIC5_9ACTN|nr:YigZ family protein [Parenemella sanctibonifatiensis]OYN91277.1 IMPACT family protein [Parenemella sanctibonifatiensis]